MADILVVEDEESIAEILKFTLEREGYTVQVAYDGMEAVEAVRRSEPQLILLDVMLPEKDGFEVCKEVRAFSKVPIIMLTARDSEVDKVLGLELGADDYVTKPFSMRELLARVKAHLRRMALDEGASVQDGKRERIVAGDVVIDLRHYEVTRAGEPVLLTHREFELLAFLAARPGVVYTREELLEQVWGTSYLGDGRTVDVTVRRLREKLEPDPSNPRYVMTKRGVGYFFRR
ncbi:DNA-binding response regulator [Alicyclobacillus cellulosilyticus]|uniref:DNA-binding response regulator n=1 Tax=Alicyclobacillus cellulosilyticus TaxID=1003997 RepID=A0A917K2J0_9BACL|nr:response regulator [Alicyclobacillus cellulosilyticus]GGI95206.1 DNA-binding response regulator [Alicyclobacillus cellulosilyticus]